MTRNERRKVAAMRKANRLERALGMAQAAINHRTRGIVKDNLSKPKPPRDYHAGMVSSIYAGDRLATARQYGRGDTRSVSNDGFKCGKVIGRSSDFTD